MIPVTPNRGVAVGLREQKKQEMRAAIAASALSLFRSVGFERARVRDITTALRISEATFFNYFPTKQAVLEAIAADLVQRSLKELRDAVALDAPFADRLDGIIGHFGADFGDDRELLRLLARHTRLLDGRQVEGPYPEHRQLVRELFADGQRRGEVDTGISPSQLAEIYEATVVATVEGWLDDDNDDGRLSDRMDRAVRLLLRGCAPPT